jgi:hypothetical protein
MLDRLDRVKQLLAFYVEQLGTVMPHSALLG